MNKSHLLINEQALQVLPSLAIALGLNEAIALQQVHYWLNNVKNAGRIDADGNKWVYNTYQEWQEGNFPFWSEDKIQRVFLSLEKQGVLISKQLDAKSRDMTKFYRIDYDKLCAMDSLKSASSMTAKLHDVKMNQRIPENTTEKPDIFDMLSQNEAIAQQVRDAQIALESALSVNPWPWDSSAIWRKFSKWVMEEYARDPKAFEDYKVWREGQGKFKGAMSNTAIRRDPQMFMDTSWPSFLAGSSMYGNQNDKSFAL